MSLPQRLTLSLFLAGSAGLALLPAVAAPGPEPAAGAPVSQESFYSLKTTTLDGKPSNSGA